MAATYVYGPALTALAKGSIDLEGDTIKISLHTASYTPNQDTHEFFDDVTNEVSGTGYTAGGEALDNKALTYSAADNTLTFDADDVIWAASTITDARYAVIRKDTGTDSTSPLIAYIDFEGDVGSTNADFTVEFHATNGVFQISTP